MIAALAAEALFVSPLQRSDHSTAVEVDAAVTAMVLQHGTNGCAALLAQAYGDDMTSAACRMSWCRSVLARTPALA